MQTKRLFGMLCDSDNLISAKSIEDNIAKMNKEEGELKNKRFLESIQPQELKTMIEFTGSKTGKISLQEF